MKAEAVSGSAGMVSHRLGSINGAVGGEIPSRVVVLATVDVIEVRKQ